MCSSVEVKVILVYTTLVYTWYEVISFFFSRLDSAVILNRIDKAVPRTSILLLFLTNMDN